MTEPVGTVRAINASLTLVLLDRSAAKDWKLSLPVDGGESFTPGHPAQIMEAFEAADENDGDEDEDEDEEDDDEDADDDAGFTGMHHAFQVGSVRSLALELEGATGEADVYCLADDRAVIVEPPRSWWLDEDNHGDKAKQVHATFAKVLTTALPEDAQLVDVVDVRSGALIAFDMWHRLEGLDTAASGLAGQATAEFGDEMSGVVVTLRSGRYRVFRQIIEPRWAAVPLVAAHLVRES